MRQLTSSFSFSPGYQPMIWCHLHLVWVFTLWLTYSRQPHLGMSGSPFPADSRSYKVDSGYKPLITKLMEAGSASLSGVWGRVGQTLARFYRFIHTSVSPVFYQRWLQVLVLSLYCPQRRFKWSAMKSEPFTYTRIFPQHLQPQELLARVLEVYCQWKGVDRCFKCPRVCHLGTQTSIITFELRLQDKWLESTMSWVTCCTDLPLCAMDSWLCPHGASAS